MFKPVWLPVFVTACLAVEIKVLNKEAGPVWIGIQGYNGSEHLTNGGFELGVLESRSVFSPKSWSGRIWARTWCDPGGTKCATGDCGNGKECEGYGGEPPATVVEITLKGCGGLDYYNVTFVEGFNIAASIEPVNGKGDGSRYSCKPSSCKRHLNNECPSDLGVRNAWGPIACKTPCIAFDTDEYCCRGDFASPEKCKPAEWPKNYGNYFRNNCPDGVSFGYNDFKNFTCQAKKYIVTFGI